MKLIKLLKNIDLNVQMHVRNLIIILTLKHNFILLNTSARRFKKIKMSCIIPLFKTYIKTDHTNHDIRNI